MKWTDQGGGDFEQAPPGSHIARCIRIIDIGTQQGEYEGRATSARQCLLFWETPNALMEDGQPFIIGKFYTSSLGKKANLRKDLANWRGRDFTEDELKGFEAKNILGAPCMLSVTAKPTGKSGVSGVMALPKGVQCPPQVNKSQFFSLDHFDQEVFDSLSDYFKQKIQQSPEYKAAMYPSSGNQASGTKKADDFEDDVPF